MLLLKLHLNGIIQYLFSYLNSFTQGKVSKIYPCFSFISNLFLFIANSNIVWIYCSFILLLDIWAASSFCLRSKSYCDVFIQSFLWTVLVSLEKCGTVELQVLQQMDVVFCFWRCYREKDTGVLRKGSSREYRA